MATPGPFVDLPAAQRMEDIQSWRRWRYAKTYQALHPNQETSLEQLGGGFLIYCAPGSPLNPQVMNAVTTATQKLWPSVPVVPIMVPYATDGAYTRAAGIPTYGIQGFFMDRDDIRFHGRDERLLITSFYEGQAFLYTLVKSLSTAK